MADIHLDTSWCPVCECEIPPKRFTVPVTPPPQSTAIRSSQTTRGKNGTIKARPGGLVQGTGRVRPVLNKVNSSKGKLSRSTTQLPEEPIRTRTVIDPEPTPLYCSEECRLKDLEDSWPVTEPPVHTVLDAPPSRRASRIQLDAHPSQINPARASPPPPSPTLPPVPPNSWRMPVSVKLRRSRELNFDELAACIMEVDEHSDSSSASGTSFTASDRSPVEERDLNDNSNLFTDPQPPPLAPLPLHPHRPSAPVVPPGANRDKDQGLRYDRGVMMTSRRLQELLTSGAADDEQTRAERREREERQRKEEARLRRWDVTGGMSRSSSNDREKKEEPAFDPLRWTEVVYQYSASSSGASPASPGIPSTHRRASDTDKKIRAQTPSRSQSALELYAKYPLFARSSASVSRNANKSSASLVTNYAPVYGETSSSASAKSSVSGTSTKTAGAEASALALPGVDPEMYVGKKLGGPRRMIAKGVEGKLVIPDVLLRPPPQVSSSLPSGSGLPAPTSSGMRRSGSEAVITRRTGRSSSALGAVRESDEAEGGVWHRPEDGSEDSSSVTHSSASGRSRRSKGKGVASRPPSSAPGWNYESKGPVYDAVPPLPVNQRRYEEVFVPDSAPETDSAGEQPGKDDFIMISPLHARDKELGRRPICEVGRRRGEHGGKSGWWVEKEWEVRAIPERKRLFLFGGGKY